MIWLDVTSICTRSLTANVGTEGANRFFFRFGHFLILPTDSLISRSVLVGLP
jgi:hypothetical protein